MTKLTFKQFDTLITEQVELYMAEAKEEGLSEGAVLDAAVSVAKALGDAFAGFRRQFKRAPTPSEAAAIRKKLRDAKAASEKNRAERAQASRVAMKRDPNAKPTSAAAAGRAAEQEWIDNL